MKNEIERIWKELPIDKKINVCNELARSQAKRLIIVSTKDYKEVNKIILKEFDVLDIISATQNTYFENNSGTKLNLYYCDSDYLEVYEDNGSNLFISGYYSPTNSLSFNNFKCTLDEIEEDERSFVDIFKIIEDELKK